MDKIVMSILIGVSASVSMILLSLIRLSLIRRVRIAELINQLRSGDFIRHLSLSDLINYFKVTASPQKKANHLLSFPMSLI
jgi:hypothetical protein